MALSVCALPISSSETIFVVIDRMATAPTPAIRPIVTPETIIIRIQKEYFVLDTYCYVMP